MATAVSLEPPQHATDDHNVAASSSTSSSIAAVHADVILAHILTRLDPATLATAASASTHLRGLCAEEKLWRKFCIATWPSLEDPTARHVISTFPAGHRSIFSDAFPSLQYNHPNSYTRRSLPSPSPPPPELISAVDIHYNGEPVFSRIHRTETDKNCFLTSPLWVEMLDPNEVVPTPVRFSGKGEDWVRHVEESVCLSWVVIDPARKRAANVSSRRPVWVRRHWLTRDVEAAFAVVLAAEAVRCLVKVTWSGKAGEEAHVIEVNLVMEDAEGGRVNGKEGVDILQRAMESGVRKRVESAKVSYERFSCMVKERRERKHRRKKVRDIASTLLALVAFLLLFCFLAGVHSYI